MTLHPVSGWLLFGIIVAGYVRLVVGRLPHHRLFQPLFYGAIVLAGPLVLLLALVPGDSIYRVTSHFREKMDRRQILR